MSLKYGGMNIAATKAAIKNVPTISALFNFLDPRLLKYFYLKGRVVIFYGGVQ